MGTAGRADGPVFAPSVLSSIQALTAAVPFACTHARLEGATILCRGVADGIGPNGGGKGQGKGARPRSLPVYIGGAAGRVVCVLANGHLADQVPTDLPGTPTLAFQR